MSWSLPIIRIAGIQLRIHITFLLLIVWLALGYYAEGGSAAAAGRVFFIFQLAAGISYGRRPDLARSACHAHELRAGHANRRHGRAGVRIYLRLCGIVCEPAFNFHRAFCLYWRDPGSSARANEGCVARPAG